MARVWIGTGCVAGPVGAGSHAFPCCRDSSLRAESGCRLARFAPARQIDAAPWRWGGDHDGSAFRVLGSAGTDRDTGAAKRISAASRKNPGLSFQAERKPEPDT